MLQSGRPALLAALLAALLPCACSRAPRQPTAPARLQITDDLGRTVVLQQPARRIASLSPSNTEILFAIGCGDRLVLRDSASSHPAAAQRLPAVSAFQLSTEHLAGFNPDLVLFSHLDAGRLQALQSVGFAAASFDPRTLEALFANIRAIGTLCGGQAGAKRLLDKLQRRATAVTAAVQGRPRPAVYIEVDGSNPQRPWAAGPGSFIDQLLRLAGGRNAVGHLSRPVDAVSAEEILRAGPEIILLANVEDDRRGGLQRFRERPGWAQLVAVREGRIIDSIHRDLLSRPGPRALDGLEALATALHPESLVTGRR